MTLVNNIDRVKGWDSIRPNQNTYSRGKGFSHSHKNLKTFTIHSTNLKASLFNRFGDFIMAGAKLTTTLFFLEHFTDVDILI